MNRQLLITCEHAGNRVPEAYRYLFEQHREVLNTHRGLDIGALELASTIGRVMQTEPYIHKVTRLLVDLNRSLHNSSLFSEFVKTTGQKEKEHIINTYYKPHREQVYGKIKEFHEADTPVIHLAVHTFTPELDGTVREADIGFLYDPERGTEKKMCWAWRRELNQRLPQLAYRMNYPYRGTMDGFVTALKKEFGEDEYWGIEMEVNQRFPESNDEERWRGIQRQIAYSLKSVLQKTDDKGDGV